MPGLLIATAAAEVPMGAQHYQEAIAQRGARALADVSDQDWQVRRLIARSMRSPLPGTRRLPMGLLGGASTRIRRAAGRTLYPRNQVVHRMDLILPPPPGPHVVTLHDVVAWKFADESDPVPAATEELKGADAVICVSQFTADEAADLLGLTNTVVIPNGIDEELFEASPLPPAEQAAIGITKPFVLYAGGSAERKNLTGLAEMWRAPNRGDLQLVLAGPLDERRRAIFPEAHDVVHTGRVPDATLKGLMAAASAIVVPSLYEGFGLPALEALAVGTPLVCANTSSLPEVVGDAAVLVPPDGPSLWKGVEQVLGGGAEVADRVHRGRTRARSYTWGRSARMHAEVWSAVARDHLRT